MVKIFRQAASVSGLTFASRLLGVVRDAVIASLFGTTIQSDAFFIAFRPFDLLRKLFSEGILSLSLVPVFSRYLSQGKKEEVIAMFWSALCLVSILAAVAGGLGIYLAPLLAKILAPGFVSGGYAHSLTTLLIKMMLPYLLVILSLALSMGALNALGNFHGPAATPILLNAGILLAVVSFSTEPQALTLGLGVTLGGLLQLGFQIPHLMRSGIIRPKGLVLFHPGVGQAARRFLPVLAAAAAFQVNLLISSLLGSTLGDGSISALYFADRLVQFPLSLLATSAATVFLPLLSKKAGSGSMDEVAPAFEQGVRLVLFLTLPAMAGIMALDRHIVALLFGRGAFDALSVANTAEALFFMATGLWALAGTRLYITCHFAVSDFGLPLFASGVSMAVHLILALMLKDVLGVPGLCLSLSLGAGAGFFVLAAGSSYGPSFKRLLVSACRALFVSGIMFFLVRWAGDLWIPAKTSTLVQGFRLMMVICLGAASFFLLASLAARPEMMILKRVLGQRGYVRN